MGWFFLSLPKRWRIFALFVSCLMSYNPFPPPLSPMPKDAFHLPLFSPSFGNHLFLLLPVLSLIHPSLHLSPLPTLFAFHLLCQPSEIWQDVNIRVPTSIQWRKWTKIEVEIRRDWEVKWNVFYVQGNYAEWSINSSAIWYINSLKK